MKKTITTLAIAFLTVPMFIGCNSENNAERLLSNEEIRKSILSKIAENSEYMEELYAITNFSENHHGMKHDSLAMMGMMQKHPEMVEKMMRNMLQMCETDSTMCNLMAAEMTGNPKMKKFMENHIHGSETHQAESMMNGKKMMK